MGEPTFTDMIVSDFVAEITTCLMLIIVGWLALGDSAKNPSIAGFVVLLGGISLVGGLVYFLVTRRRPPATATTAVAVETTKTDDGTNVGTAVGAVGKVGTSEGTKPAVTVVYKDSKDDTDPLTSSYGKKST